MNLRHAATLVLVALLLTGLLTVTFAGCASLFGPSDIFDRHGRELKAVGSASRHGSESIAFSRYKAEAALPEVTIAVRAYGLNVGEGIILRVSLDESFFKDHPGISLKPYEVKIDGRPPDEIQGINFFDFTFKSRPKIEIDEEVPKSKF